MRRLTLLAAVIVAFTAAAFSLTPPPASAGGASPVAAYSWAARAYLSLEHMTI
jgi:hypothetical protein